MNTMLELRKPDFITFTGADDQTSIEGMIELASRYPIEFGILFSASRQGSDPRYPSRATIERIVASGLDLAAHLCGGHAQNVMLGVMPAVPINLKCFSRIQINHVNPDAARIAEFAAICERPCIAQCRDPDFPDNTDIEWLFDASGGCGIAPAFWPKHPGRIVGYAGGLGPENVRTALEAIASTGPYWIDMESGVRTGDRFDLDRLAEVCRTVFGE